MPFNVRLSGLPLRFLCSASTFGGESEMLLPTKTLITNYKISWREKKDTQTNLSLFLLTEKSGGPRARWSLRCLCRRSSLSARGPALYGVEQRKWPWPSRGWLAAPQPSEAASTNCSYMAWPLNEITEVFSGEVELLSGKEGMSTGKKVLRLFLNIALENLIGLQLMSIAPLSLIFRIHSLFKSPLRVPRGRGRRLQTGCFAPDNSTRPRNIRIKK